MFNVPAKTGVIVLVNTWPTPLTGALPVGIAEAVINAAGPVDSGLVATHGRGEPTDYDGRYRAEPGLPVTVEPVQGGGLSFAKPAPGEGTLHAPALLEPAGEADSFRVADGRGAGETAVFERNESGAVTSFTLGGFKYRKLG